METTTRRYCHLHHRYDCPKCDADLAVLEEYGHPEGPVFGFGPRNLDCRNYSEHRENFRRIKGQWHCGECHEDDYKHARSCELVP